MPLQDKVAIVTGAGSGIGRAIALALAGVGAKVLATGIKGDRLDTLAAACGDNVRTLVGDITDDNIYKRLVDAAVENFGRLDILVNNAGVAIIAPAKTGKSGKLEAAGLELDNQGRYFGLQVYDEQFKTNVRAVVGMCEASLPELIKAKGNIVNIASVAAKVCFTAMPAYCMSKSAVAMLTSCLSVELGPLGVRVNSVNPGLIRTAIVDDQTTAEESSKYAVSEKRHPIGRIGEPSEIANLVLYLADDEKAGFITGSGVTIDGGLTNVHC